MGGLDHERFTLSFPFAWKKHRYLFDRYVEFQRAFGLRRKVPDGLVPHMGSQWWCLTRQTLSAILQDPERPKYDRFFKRVWIPDESYYQTLSRIYFPQSGLKPPTLVGKTFKRAPKALKTH